MPIAQSAFIVYNVAMNLQTKSILKIFSASGRDNRQQTTFFLKLFSCRMCEAAQGRFSFAEKIGGRRLTRVQAINNNSGVSGMRRKIGFLIGAAFLLVSCASSVKRAAMSMPASMRWSALTFRMRQKLRTGVEALRKRITFRGR